VRRPDLVPDCERCAALCCVAPAFDASAAFAFDKAAGVRCRHLTGENRCSIHEALVERGFPGCAAYDCYGAGQRVTRAFEGSGDERRRNEAFLILQGVHELLWLLSEAAKLRSAPDDDLGGQIAAEIAALDAIAQGPIASVFELDLRPHREAARALLRRVGESLSAP
jgi:hypothetical protein